MVIYFNELAVEMVADAVIAELVSTSKFPATVNFAGKFAPAERTRTRF